MRVQFTNLFPRHSIALQGDYTKFDVNYAIVKGPPQKLRNVNKGAGDGVKILQNWMISIVNGLRQNCYLFSISILLSFPSPT